MSPPDARPVATPSGAGSPEDAPRVNGAAGGGDGPKPTGGTAGTARAPPSSARRLRFVDTSQCQMPTLPAGDVQSSGVSPSVVISWLPCGRRAHQIGRAHV